MPYANKEYRKSYQREWRQKNRERLIEKERLYRESDKFKERKANGIEEEQKRNSHLKRRYGITQEYYLDLLKQQNGKCKLCDESDPSKWGNKYLEIDHCHYTGKIRGLLCRTCNTQLGSFETLLRKLPIVMKYINLNISDICY